MFNVFDGDLLIIRMSEAEARNSTHKSMIYLDTVREIAHFQSPSFTAQLTTARVGFRMSQCS
jgi:hypothetical protein